MRRTSVGVAAACVAAALACGCTDAAAPSSGAQLRVVAAVTGADSLDVLVDGTPVATGLLLGQTSAYRDVPAGSVSVDVRLAGSSGVLTRLPATLEAGKRYTVVPAGPVTGVEPLLEADTGVVPAAGTAKLRAIHAAPGAQALDLFLTQPDFPAEFQWVFPYAYRSVTNFQQSAPGDFRVRLKSPGGGSILLDVGPLALAAGQSRTIVFLDGPGGSVHYVVLDDRN